MFVLSLAYQYRLFFSLVQKHFLVGAKLYLWIFLGHWPLGLAGAEAAGILESGYHWSLEGKFQMHGDVCLDLWKSPYQPRKLTPNIE